MLRKKQKISLIKLDCRRGCGAVLHTVNRPIHGTQEDYNRYHGICSNCLTDEEKQEMSGPMLLRTAENICNQ